MLPTPTETQTHAGIAATYYRMLLLEGVAPTQAAMMASIYLNGLLQQEEPKDVWEEEG